MAWRLLSHCGRIRRGYSLIEMVTAVAIFSILMLALQSTVMLAAKAMPDNGSRASLLTVESRALNRIAHDLHYATSVTLTNNRTLQLVVADQDGDGADETITYQWNGTTGATLTRTRNSGAASVLASGVRNFACTMRKKSIATTTSTYGSATSAELALASFSDYSGVSGTTSNTLNLSSSNYASEYFRFNTSAVPANATSIRITRVGVWMQSLGILGTVSGEIRRAVGNGTYSPSTIRYGSVSGLSNGLLSLSLGWTNFPFSDVVITNPQEEMEFYLSASGLLNVASVQYRYNSNAPADGYRLFWSSNSGSSWSPSTSNLNQQDMIFTVYGTVTAPTVTTATTTKYYLTGMDLRLCMGTRDTDAQELSVSTPNLPEVTGP